MEQKKLILVTNDDGFEAQGIVELARLMQQYGDVIMVAPEGVRSGASCSITSTCPVELREVSTQPGLRVVSCSGTPVDCVKLALEQVCPRKPDLLVSGINHGDNASISVHYSGTMGAVFEACMKGVPAIGFSLRTRSRQCDFAPYFEAIHKITAHTLSHGLPQDVCLNVNFPEVKELAGVRVCRMGRGAWNAEWASAHHPRGGNHFWLIGSFENKEPESADTDYWALDHGYASVTPVSMDMTAYDSMAILTDLNFNPSVQ